MPGDTGTYHDIMEFKERAIREAYETAKKAKNTLPLSERDLSLLKGNITPESEPLTPPGAMGGYTTFTDYIQQDEPESHHEEPSASGGSVPGGTRNSNYTEGSQNQHGSPGPHGVRNPLEGLFGGILGNLKSQDIILVAIAFMLFNSKADNDLLLAIMFILLS